MLNINNINNEDQILNNTIAQQAKVSGIEKKAVPANPYLKVVEYGDTLEISDLAKKLCDKDKDIKKFTAEVMKALNEPDDPKELSSIMNNITASGYISNDQLAEKMINPSTGTKDDKLQNKNELLKLLFADTSESDINPFEDLLKSNPNKD